MAFSGVEVDVANPGNQPGLKYSVTSYQFVTVISAVATRPNKSKKTGQSVMVLLKLDI